MTAWQVHKFGGSSVADAACMERVARILEDDPRRRVAAVLSACRGVTDALLALVTAAERHEDGDAERLGAIRQRHVDIASALLGPADSGRNGGRAEFDGRTASGGARVQRRDLVLPALHAVQARFGWLPRGALNHISRRLGIPPAELHGVASFYHLFSLEPQRARVLHVCDDLACRIACTLPFGDGSDGTFNPDRWMEVKEQRKVDPFIVYAMAAAGQALDDADWHPKSDRDQEATGVLIGSGIGGIGTIYDASVT